MKAGQWKNRSYGRPGWPLESITVLCFGERWEGQGGLQAKRVSKWHHKIGVFFFFWSFVFAKLVAMGTITADQAPLRECRQRRLL